MALANVVGCLAFIFIPESFPYLYRAGKYDEGRKVIELFVKKTKTEVASNFIQSFHDRAIEANQRIDVKQNLTILDLFRHGRHLAHVALNISGVFFTCSITYYGLSLNAASLPGNLYVNNAINGAVEIVAYFICVLVLGSALYNFIV